MGKWKNGEMEKWKIIAVGTEGQTEVKSKRK